MVVESDVAELYNENIESFLLGACHDADTAGLYNGYEPNKKAYMDQAVSYTHLDVYKRQYWESRWDRSCGNESENGL